MVLRRTLGRKATIDSGSLAGFRELRDVTVIWFQKCCSTLCLAFVFQGLYFHNVCCRYDIYNKFQMSIQKVLCCSIIHPQYFSIFYVYLKIQFNIIVFIRSTYTYLIYIQGQKVLQMQVRQRQGGQTQRVSEGAKWGKITVREAQHIKLFDSIS